MVIDFEDEGRAARVDWTEEREHRAKHVDRYSLVFEAKSYIIRYLHSTYTVS